MTQLAQYSQYTVTSSGLELNLGNVRGYVSVVVDVVAGQSTGTGITLRIIGQRVNQSWSIPYGAPALSIPFSGNLIKVSGTGAVIELVVDTDPVTVSPLTLTPGTVDVGNQPTVHTELDQLLYTPGGTVPTYTLAAGITDPPQVTVTGGKAVPVKTET